MKKNKLELHGDTEIEVVMRKKMTVSKYRELLQGAKKKGWDVKAYQNGFYQ